MNESRECARAHCARAAVVTMTFSYQEARAVLGGLSAQPIPGALDLCAEHAQKATIPVGWEMLVLKNECENSAKRVEEEKNRDGLTALADALAEAEEAAKIASSDRRESFAARCAVLSGNNQDPRNTRGLSERSAQAPSIGDIPNPWISRVEIPQRSQGPKLRIIEGGENAEKDR